MTAPSLVICKENLITFYLELIDKVSNNVINFYLEQTYTTTAQEPSIYIYIHLIYQKEGFKFIF